MVGNCRQSIESAAEEGEGQKEKLIKKLVFKFVNYEIDEKTFLALKRKLET